MIFAGWIATAALLIDLAIRLGLSVRVIMRRPPIGVCLAWLCIILPFPIVGVFLYLFFGEYRLGHARLKRAATAYAAGHRQFMESKKTSRLESPAGPRWESLVRAGEALLDARYLPGNGMSLLRDAEAAFPSIINDIDNAKRSCDLETYIWSPGGCADDVSAAVIRAAERGVRCRVLLDAMGSKQFLRHELSREMRAKGVEVRTALSTNPFSILAARLDLRLHRKIIVIDGEVAYTGSLNLADPRLFKQDAGVGQWVDAATRVTGPAVEALAMVFLTDWAVESGTPLEQLFSPRDFSARGNEGSAGIQVLSSGPAGRTDAIEQILLMAIYEAQSELVLTTPYFVPSESMMFALLSASARGVDVTLIVPAKVDSRMTQFASRSNEGDLLAAGVRVAHYRDGLLHTKSVTVDGDFSLFGSLNLDYRSLHLDFEVMLAVYDRGFTAELSELQHHYLDCSTVLDSATLQSRSRIEEFAENVARLAGPML